MKGNLAILVISCDNYRDVWKPFFELFSKFWPDCPYRLYLGSNKADFEYPDVTVVKSGEDISWADNVRKYLAQIDEEYVLTFLEDFFICRPVPTAAIESAFKTMVKDHIDLFSFTLPKKGEPFPQSENVYYIDPRAEYCVNTAIAIRAKNAFLTLLKPGYSAWDFEVKNSKQVNEAGSFPGVFVTSGIDYFPLLNGIWRGKWVPGSVRFCRRVGIDVDTSVRPFMEPNERIWEFAKGTGRRLMNPSIRRMLKRLLIRFGHSRRFVSQD